MTVDGSAGAADECLGVAWTGHLFWGAEFTQPTSSEALADIVAHLLDPPDWPLVGEL